MTSRIREREAEFTKQVKEREEQIGQLKDRLKVLSKKLTDTVKEKDFKFPRDRERVARDQEENGAELQNIIKQVSFIRGPTKSRTFAQTRLECVNWDIKCFFCFVCGN